MNQKKIVAILLAFLAAILYAINIPLSKLLLTKVEPVFMSSFLYLGAGLGIGILYLFTNQKSDNRARLTRKELPYTIGMIVLDIAAPIFLMIGLTIATGANASLLSNFEIVATSLVALVVFKEIISKRLWIAILFITIGSMLLSFEDLSSFDFSLGSLFVLAACICWGFENNCTRMMASKSTYQIVILKGFFSGMGSFLIALLVGERIPSVISILEIMLLGFVAYGLSIFFYVRAQNELGASKTSAYYAVAPFVGTALSCVILKESLEWMYFVALLIMMVGASLVVVDTLIRNHTHLHTHTMIHTHDGSTHVHSIQHSHSHNHLAATEKHTHHHATLDHTK